MTIIDSIKTYMQTCSLITAFNVVIGVDNLPERNDGFAIETVPCEPYVRKYINGSALKQYMFNFTSKASYGDDVRQNIENIGFFEQFSDWLDTQSKAGVLPTLPTGKTAKQIKAVTTGYAFDTEMDTAKYMIQCVLYYHETA